MPPCLPADQAPRLLVIVRGGDTASMPRVVKRKFKRCDWKPTPRIRVSSSNDQRPSPSWPLAVRP